MEQGIFASNPEQLWGNMAQGWAYRGKAKCSLSRIHDGAYVIRDRSYGYILS